jgi:diketogulonate reductase-like aldo/keto reductase
MFSQLLNRRRFNGLFGGFGFALVPALVAQRSEASATDAEAKPAVRTVTFPGGTTVPAVGQGSWHLGQGRHPAAGEEEALRTGISLGMTLIDTSGNYGSGRSEELIGRVIADQRDQVFVVTKVETNEVAGDGIARACEASLARLRTTSIDLYLLHWPVPTNQFSAVVAGFEQLRAKGKIRAWGVSNFNAGQMDDLFHVPDGHRCVTNQVPYSLNNRNIERDVLPWCKEHAMPVMAYSPLGGDNSRVIGDPTLTRIGEAHGCSAAAVALAWVTGSGHVIAIPESGSPAHVKENVVALSLTLTPQDLQILDAAFPGPNLR